MQPTTTPIETLKISPEALEVANCYLETQSVKETASTLNLPTHLVTEYLARREVRSYIDSVFADIGFNNRYKLRAAMDAIIQQKFEELTESGVGSNKDIADLLLLSHKMSMEILDREIQLQKLSQSDYKNQTNIQINQSGILDNSKYGELIQRLLNT